MVKAPDAEPTQIGLEGEFYPTVAFSDQTGSYYSLLGKPLDPMISMLVYTGDLGMDDGAPQSVYALDKSRTTMLTKKDGTPYRIDLRPGESTELPERAGHGDLRGPRARGTRSRSARPRASGSRWPAS